MANAVRGTVQNGQTVFEFQLPKPPLSESQVSFHPQDIQAPQASVPGMNLTSFELNLREVFLKVVFLKIEDINTVGECFSGMFFWKAKWREPALDTTSVREIDKINWSSFWNPQLGINNVLGTCTAKIWNDLEFGPNGEAYAIEKRRVKGTFTEKMELHEFPFDVQDLSLLITSELPEEQITLEEDEDDISNVVTYSFVDESQWHLKKFVQSEPRTTLCPRGMSWPAPFPTVRNTEQENFGSGRKGKQAISSLLPCLEWHNERHNGHR